MIRKIKDNIGKINKNVLNISIIVLIFIGLLIYIILNDGLKNIFLTIKSIKYSWMLLGLLFIIIYWLIEAYCLHIITKQVYPKQKFKDSLRVTMIGQLFNCITPFASGGQPIQAITMKLEGKSFSKSASILLLKFIMYQVTLVIYTLIIILFKYSYFKALLNNFVSLAFIGFLINFVVITFLILIGYNKKVVIKIVSVIFKFLHKLKFIKHTEEKNKKIVTSISTFNKQFKDIKTDTKLLIKLFIYSFIELTVYFAITYIIYRGFNQNTASFFNIISAQAFLGMIVAFVPIPGSGIAAEGGFLVIFSTFFAPNTINMATLFWRLYTFYLPIIVGTIFMVTSNKKDEILKEGHIKNE